METQKKEGAPRMESAPREGAEMGLPLEHAHGLAMHQGELPGIGPGPSFGEMNGQDKAQALAPEPGGKRPQKMNNTRRLRMERMMSKAELARRAGVSTLTIDRVERGLSCRMDTKRKIIEALGLTPSDRTMVFAEDD
jgi:DNA-binding XRE family transcriptional regulator